MIDWHNNITTVIANNLFLIFIFIVAIEYTVCNFRVCIT